MKTGHLDKYHLGHIDFTITLNTSKNEIAAEGVIISGHFAFFFPLARFVRAQNFSTKEDFEL